MSEEHGPAEDIPGSPLQMELPPPVGREGYRLGQEGPGVVALQIRLGCPGTGVYDTTTEHAVRRFQAEFGKVADGVADQQVHNALGLPWMIHA